VLDLRSSSAWRACRRPGGATSRICRSDAARTTVGCVVRLRCSIAEIGGTPRGNDSTMHDASVGLACTIGPRRGYSRRPPMVTGMMTDNPQTDEE